MATMLMTGGIGGAIAKKGIKEYGEKVLQKKLAEGLSQEAAKKAAQSAVARRIGFGMGAGSFAGSMGMESGAIYGETEDPEVSLAHGAVAGALDAIVGVGILKNFGPGAKELADQVTGAIDKSIPREVASVILKEGGTEALQGFVQQHAKYWVENEGANAIR